MVCAPFWGLRDERIRRNLPRMTTTAPAARAVGTVTLQPFRQRYWLPIVGSLVAAVVPVYITAFVIASTGGRIVPVSVAAAVTLVIAALVAWRFSRARLVLQAGGMVEHGLLGRTRTTPREAVASAVLLALYDTQSVQTRRQLFVLDAGERTLLRMSGASWSDQHMRTVLRHFDVLVETIDTPMTLHDLRHTRPGILRWSERHPWRGNLLMISLGLVCCVSIAITATLTIG
ncbi:MAG: hypothetical protein JWQ92_2963 [Amnibacterium sp.]|nr:hypothetical protein [Amnibacterium sp.]